MKKTDLIIKILLVICPPPPPSQEKESKDLLSVPPSIQFSSFSRDNCCCGCPFTPCIYTYTVCVCLYTLKINKIILYVLFRNFVS